MKKCTVLSVFCVFPLMALLFLLPLPPAYGQEKEPAYVGMEACKDCHEDYYKSYEKSIHGKKAIPNSPAASQGCESCHGPGGLHVEKGGGKGVGGLITFNKSQPPDRKSAMCQKCHENSKELGEWKMSRHDRAQVSCDSCHAVHSTSRRNLKSREPYLCLTCHKDVRNQVNRQSRHPIQEGKIKCSDCHTPHGSFGNKMLKADSETELCFKCHQEKRGPFGFEHPPVVEKCATCHQPHGSNHNNLLVSKVPQLCQACHTTGLGHASRAYTQQHSFGGTATAGKNKFFAQGCLNCHGNIHGSNRSPQFLR